VSTDWKPERPRPKRVTRRTALSLRDALTDAERASASAAIAVVANQLLDGVTGTVALYAPKGSEVDPTAIDRALRARGVVVVYPRVVDGQRLLAFHRASPDELVAARFGLREPPADDVTRVAVDQIAAFVVPVLAFDRDGGRIGWGRGHYDATLAAAPSALRIGLAFACQLVDHIDHEPHDVRLHHVITDAASYPG
jgi:5-formyltetrahydrofolate cyclo-ligase